MTDWLSHCITRVDLIEGMQTYESAKKIVEIGVELGMFSEEILVACKEAIVYLIDPWTYQMNYKDPCNVKQMLQEEKYQKTLNRIARFSDRTVVIRDYSEPASREFQDNSLDLVYLDGDHSMTSVVRDIANWWPKVRPGGILSGHDYVPGNPDTVGVIPAVENHIKQYNLELFLMNKTSDCSWAVRKAA